ncbi:MAG: discoidin domain-containing protein, partial [Flammeovirgaceae bacterium]
MWPEVFVQLKGIRYTGSFALAEIEVCPFRYHLPSKRLELVERLNLLLQYRDAETTVEKPYSLVALKHEHNFAERVRAMVLNPEDVSRYQQFKEGEILKSPSPPQVLPEVDYVIITSSALSKSFEKLATWRHRLGLRARVVRVEDIKSGSVPDTQGEDGKNAIFWHTSGYHDGGTRDEAEMIRNFIQWANVNWSTDYVLLGGDTEIIPCRQAMQSAEEPDDPWAGFNMFKYFGNIDDPDFQFQNDHPINLAKNAKAFASSEKPNNPPANVLDGKPNTSWQCSASDGNPWITLELSDPHTPVNCVKTNWVNPPASYTIAVSDDQAHWTDVYSTSSASSTEEAKFSCVSTFYVRIRITGGSSFSLQEVKIYGPAVKSDLGSAYQFTNTDTRVYLGADLQQGSDLQGNSKPVMQPPDPNASLEDNLKNFKSYVIIMNGAKAGTFIPYDENASATQLGWRFIDDLLSSPATVSTTPTRFIDICGPADYHGKPFAVLSDGHWVNYTPTDLYYADVASGQYPPTDRHAWDADGNRVYGERYED